MTHFDFAMNRKINLRYTIKFLYFLIDYLTIDISSLRDWFFKMSQRSIPYTSAESDAICN